MSAVLETNEHRARLAVMDTSHGTDLFLDAQTHLSERAKDTYRRFLDKLAERHPDMDVDDYTSTHLTRFLGGQERKKDGSKKAAATIAQQHTIINLFFRFLATEGLVARNPTMRNGQIILTRPRLLAPEDNDNVKTVTSAEVRLMLEDASKSARWNERLAVHCLAYLGPRRKAIALAKIGDYDRENRTLRFHEKGSKWIKKPVPDELADVIDAAIAAGVYGNPVDPTRYLIPGDAEQRRDGERDERIIYRLVKRVADRVGVDSHVHALRAAFAVNYLEQKPGQIVGLQKLMGHRRIETTMVYLRRMDRQAAMETVRDLSWGAK